MDADLSDDPAYPAQPDQSNSFSRKTARLVFESRFEIPSFRLAVQIKKLLGEGAHEGCGMFCDKAILRAFDTANDHVVFCGSLDIDVVQTTSVREITLRRGAFWIIARVTWVAVRRMRASASGISRPTVSLEGSGLQ
jgi:hypothetical protein